jgi:NAD-dependent deacetylase
MTLDSLIAQAAARIAGASRIVVLTGAGVSRESGVPTFRDALDGLWARFEPTALATPEAFAQSPKLVWDFYEYRRALMRPARPNAGHLALAALEARITARGGTFTLITQNVDSLHEAAGSRHVLRLHGRIDANRCAASCQGMPTPVDVEALAWNQGDGPPACPRCGAPARPDVVWFGEHLPEPILDAAIEAASAAEVMLVVGTSGLVTPAAHLPAQAAANGACVIEVNPEASAITPQADIWLAAPSADALPRLLAALG